MSSTSLLPNFQPSQYAPFMQTAMVDIGNDIELCVEVGGDPKNPAILLIMGLGCQLVYWPNDFVKKLIDAGYYVIRFDNRDVGLSTKIKRKHIKHIDESNDSTDKKTRKSNSTKSKRPNFQRLLRRSALGLATTNEPIAYQLVDMADDVVRLINALKLDKVHVIGASLGGMIAQILTANHPDKIASLGLLFSSNLRPMLPPPYPKQLQALFTRPKDHSEAGIINHNTKMLACIGSPKYVKFDEIRDAARVFYQRSYYPLGYINQLLAVLASGSLVKYNKRTSTPTIVVHGASDRLLHPKHGKSIAKYIQGAKYVEIKDMGHDFPVELMDAMVIHFTHHFDKQNDLIN